MFGCSKQLIRFIPDILSILRLVLAFCLIPLILKDYVFCALCIFSIAAITDFLDGYIARKFAVSSEFGAALDPLADKTLMTISYILFAIVNFIPIYVTFIVVSRDVLILSAVAICKAKGIYLKMRPLISSKINTTIQLVFLVFVLACKCAILNIPYCIEVGAIVVSASTIFSGAEYVQKYFWITAKLFKW